MDGRPPAPRPRPAPRWFRPLAILAGVWMAGWLLLSFISSTGVHCTDAACQDRADTGWLVLVATQAVWAVAAIAAWTRPSAWRYAGFAIAVIVVPATALLVTNAFYPPAFSF